MTVEELIAKLQEMPQDLEVLIETKGWKYNSPLYTEVVPGEDIKYKSKNLVLIITSTVNTNG